MNWGYRNELEKNLLCADFASVDAICQYEPIFEVINKYITDFSIDMGYYDPKGDEKLRLFYCNLILFHYKQICNEDLNYDTLLDEIVCDNDRPMQFILQMVLFLILINPRRNIRCHDFADFCNHNNDSLNNVFSAAIEMAGNFIEYETDSTPLPCSYIQLSASKIEDWIAVTNYFNVDIIIHILNRIESFDDKNKLLDFLYRLMRGFSVSKVGTITTSDYKIIKAKLSIDQNQFNEAYITREREFRKYVRDTDFKKFLEGRSEAEGNNVLHHKGKRGTQYSIGQFEDSEIQQLKVTVAELKDRNKNLTKELLDTKRRLAKQTQEFDKISKKPQKKLDDYFCEIAVKYMNSTRKKNNTKRTAVANILRDIMSQLKLEIPDEIRKAINEFDDENVTPSKIQIIVKDGGRYYEKVETQNITTNNNG